MKEEIAKIENELTQPWTEKGVANIKQCFAPTLTNEEFKIFVGLGKSLNANPFTREIWAVKYGNSPAAIFLGRDFHRRKAQEQADYDGHIVNAVYENDGFSIKEGQPEHVVNSFKDRGNLVGAFCSVYKKGIKVPFFVTVKLEEYNKGQSNWKTMPETMIKKVAEAQALRGAYQGDFRGTYDESEQSVIEASHKEMPSDNQIRLAESLLRTSAFDDYQKDQYQQEIDDEALTPERMSEIINELEMNKTDNANPSLKDIQKELDKKMIQDDFGTKDDMSAEGYESEI